MDHGAMRRHSEGGQLTTAAMQWDYVAPLDPSAADNLRTFDLPLSDVKRRLILSRPGVARNARDDESAGIADGSCLFGVSSEAPSDSA
jgi:hypothetical protein